MLGDYLEFLKNNYVKRRYGLCYHSRKLSEVVNQRCLVTYKNSTVLLDKMMDKWEMCSTFKPDNHSYYDLPQTWVKTPKLQGFQPPTTHGLR